MPQLDVSPLDFISPACPACQMSASLGLGPHLDPPWQHMACALRQKRYLLNVLS